MARAEALFGLAPERGDLLLARTFSREGAYALAVRGEAGDREPLCAAARDYFRQKGRGEELSTTVMYDKDGKVTTDASKALIGRTVKGKGVSYMENQVGWHGMAPNDEQYAQAMAELKAQLI